MPDSSFTTSCISSSNHWKFIYPLCLFFNLNLEKQLTFFFLSSALNKVILQNKKFFVSHFLFHRRLKLWSPVNSSYIPTSHLHRKDTRQSCHILCTGCENRFYTKTFFFKFYTGYFCDVYKWKGAKLLVRRGCEAWFRQSLFFPMVGCDMIWDRLVLGDTSEQLIYSAGALTSLLKVQENLMICKKECKRAAWKEKLNTSLYLRCAVQTLYHFCFRGHYDWRTSTFGGFKGTYGPLCRFTLFYIGIKSPQSLSLGWWRKHMGPRLSSSCSNVAPHDHHTFHTWSEIEISTLMRTGRALQDIPLVQGLVVVTAWSTFIYALPRRYIELSLSSAVMYIALIQEDVNN